MKGFDEVQGGIGIEIMCVVVLGENVSVGNYYFGDGYMFFFVFRDIMNEVVVDNCFVSMFYVEYFKQECNDVFFEFGFGYVVRLFCRYFGIESEFQSLFNGQGWMMVIVFGIVDSFVMECVEFLCGLWFVQNFVGYVCVFIVLVCNCFQKCCVVGIRFVQYKDYFIGFVYIMEVVEKSCFDWFWFEFQKVYDG